jgi:hypothetical protein
VIGHLADDERQVEFAAGHRYFQLVVEVVLEHANLDPGMRFAHATEYQRQQRGRHALKGADRQSADFAGAEALQIFGHAVDSAQQIARGGE